MRLGQHPVDNPAVDAILDPLLDPITVKLERGCWTCSGSLGGVKQGRQGRVIG